MATVYLHIGLPKTGTTALQHFLDDNKEVLKKHKICFPDLGYHYKNKGVLRNALFLTKNWSSEEGSDEKTIPGPYYEAGLDQVAELANEYDSIILSDESIWRSAYDRKTFWKKLKQELWTRSLDLKIIVYLRRQDLWVQSFWAQKVKTGNSYTFYEYLSVMKEEQYPTNYYDYLSYLTSVFGKKALCVRIYEKGQFQGEEGNIFSDFLEVLGLKISDGFTIRQYDRNVSINGGYLEIRRMNNSLNDFAFSNSVIKTGTKQLIQAETAADPSVYNCTWFRSLEDQQAYLAQFEESNRKVAIEFLDRTDGNLFYEPIKSLPQYKTDDRQLLIDTIRLYGRSIQLLDKHNREMRNELNQLISQMNELQRHRYFYRLIRKIKSIIKTIGKES